MQRRSEVFNHPIKVDERALVPWVYCTAANRAWQQQRVRELGYCPYCENLDVSIISKEFGSKEYRGWPSPALEAAQQAAKEGCQFCDLLCHVIDDFRLVSIHEDKKSAFIWARRRSGHFEVTIRGHQGESSPVRIFRLCEGLVPSERLHLMTRRPESTEETSWTAIPPVNRIVPTNLGDQSCVDLVGQWLQECLDSHDVGPPPISPLPTRIIEIVDECVVRLVRTKGKQGQYVALSHLWSKEPERHPTRTTQGNIQRHLEGIQINSLTPTLREAIELTYTLGYRYLWIDSLCIVQDDRDDWARESGKMCDVYGNSTLTIFAATPLGCFVPRQRFLTGGSDEPRCGRGDFERRQYRYRTKSGTDLEIIAHWELMHSRVSYDEKYLNFTRDGRDRYLFERGWVVQEWVLSPRAIVFDRDELFWSCNHVTRCECGDDNDIGPFHNHPHALRSRFRRGLGLEKLDNTTWFVILTFYSRASLTFESDRLPALSGLAKAFARFFLSADSDSKYSNYLAGCWRPLILPSLLWTEASASETKFHYRRRGSGYIAPSWSWASALVAVVFRKLGTLVQYVTSIEDACCKLATSDPTGAVESGYLIAYGPTFETDIDLTTTQRANLPHMEFATVIERDLYSNAYARLTETEQGSAKATFLLIACTIDKNLKYYERGIIIVPSKEYSGSYERVGIFEVCMRDKEEWQKGAIEDVNIEKFVERLRNGDVDEEVRRRTLLPRCTMKRVTII